MSDGLEEVIDPITELTDEEEGELRGTDQFIFIMFI